MRRSTRSRQAFGTPENRSQRLVAAAWAICAWSVLAASPAHASEERFTRTVPLGPDTSIRIEATIANVVVEGTARSDLAIEIVRRAPTDRDLAKYPIVFDAGEGEIRVAAVQADGGVDPALKTEIHVTAPQSARVELLKVFEGRIRLTNLHGTSNVELRRGPIEAAGLGGRVRLQTELGPIEVRGAELVAGGMMHLRAFNGDVRVRFARRPSDARILAVTYNGTIVSDIPLATKDKFGPHFGETTLGRGEPVLSIDIVKGNVAIKVG